MVNSSAPGTTREARQDSPGVLVFPPVLFIGTLILSLVMHWLKPLHLLPRQISLVLGFAILGPCILLVRAAERAMRRAGTNIRPDQPALAIVTDGPYRVTRNPMYLASIGLYLALALFLNSLWPLVLLPVLVGVLEWGVIRREEGYLEAKFGDSYRQYRNRVRRWL
jgi:protein-S-isoprenylcysteine O-methyltransferase Ste14